jgi:hypothetical protein
VAELVGKLATLIHRYRDWIVFWFVLIAGGIAVVFLNAISRGAV